MRQYNVQFDQDEGLVWDDGGGFDITSTDEETAVRMFRLWYRRKQAEAVKARLTAARRASLRLVRSDEEGGQHE